MTAEKRTPQETKRTWLIFGPGVVAAALGLLALLGWVAGLRWLATFGGDRIPMAPSTAILFLLFGAAVCLRARTPLSRRAFGVSAATVCLGVLVALVLFVLAFLGIQSPIEHFGVNLTETVQGAVIGHMSPVTSACFLLAGLSFLASLSLCAIRPWRAALARGSGGVLLLTCFVFLLAYLFGAPLLYGGAFIPPALNTILAFGALALALLAQAGRSAGPVGESAGDGSRTALIFVLIFLVLGAGIITGGCVLYHNYVKRYRAETNQRIDAIAKLKVGELTRWRRERIANGNLLFENASFCALVRHLFAQPADADAQRQVLDWLGPLQENNYDQIRLMDTQGVTRLSLPAALAPTASNTLREADEVLRSGKVVFKDFYRHEYDGRVYLQVMVPILDELAVGQPLGVVRLRIDPEDYLYPFIQGWPVPSQTGETLLVNRQGNEIVFLNELRFQKNTALSLRIPLEKEADLPAVMAALGHKGIVEGRDYRGVPVIGAAYPVPDSPWFLVAKEDSEEVYGRVRERLWQTVVMVGVLLFAAWACVGLVWRQRVQFYRERADAADALATLNAELEQRVSDRTAQLGAANKELEAFCYSVSHDLRAPLRHIDGYVDLLVSRCRDGLSEKGLRYVDTIAASAREMGVLIDELLEFSRTGRTAMRRESLDMNLTLQKAMTSLKESNSSRTIEWVIADLPSVRGDSAMIRQVWANLLGNAVKYSRPRESARIEVSARDGNGEIIFIVKDNGVGFDMQYAGKIFGVFQRLHSLAEFEGNGIGLATVQRVIIRHGGRVWAEAELNQGATFYFALPKS